MKRGIAILAALAALGAPLHSDDRVYLEVNPEIYERIRRANARDCFQRALKRVRRRARMARKIRRGWA